MVIDLPLLQAAASTAPGSGGSPYSPGAGGLPDLSGLFGPAVGGGAGGTGLGTAGAGGAGGTGLGAMGFGSPNMAEMQRQVCQSFYTVVTLLVS